MPKYDYILPLDDTRRAVFKDNCARIENTETGAVGPWFQFDAEMPEIAAIYRKPASQEIVIHFNDGRFCTGGVSGGSIVWWHEIQDAPGEGD